VIVTLVQNFPVERVGGTKVVVRFLVNANRQAHVLLVLAIIVAAVVEAVLVDKK
jgi:hypothetical protein